MGAIHFTSDSHFYHSRVIEYSKRPFKNVDDMNESMIKNWNSVVQSEDSVYHLGDFSFGRKEQNEVLLRRLNGHKHLIRGNHDKQDVIKATGWASVDYYQEITVDGQFLVLFHYGQRVWNKSHYGSLHLYGHSHGSLHGTSQSQDVGVDVFQYKPVNLNEIKEKMKTSPLYQYEDHHKPRSRM